MEELLSVGTNIATLVAILVGVVSGIVVAYAGFLYATAAGDPQKTGIAKNAFIGAFIGLIVAGLAFIGPRIVTDLVIKPVGGIGVETQRGLNCDGILRNQFIFQRGASTADRMNVVVSQIQSQHSECASDVWAPKVVDHGGTGGDAEGVCFSTTPGAAAGPFVAAGVDAITIKVGTELVPKSLLRKVGTTDKYKPRAESGRDSENNIIVYFSKSAGGRPSDGASCWLFYARLKQWHENSYAAAAAAPVVTPSP